MLNAFPISLQHGAAANKNTILTKITTSAGVVFPSQFMSQAAGAAGGGSPRKTQFNDKTTSAMLKAPDRKSVV